MSLYTKFVEIGRVAFVNYGPDRGKICTILDVVDQNRVLVDGPAPITGVPRQAIKVAYLTLTSIKIPIQRGARLKTLTKVFEEAKVMDQWKATATYKKIQDREAKTAMSDFDRFKTRVERKKVKLGLVSLTQKVRILAHHNLKKLQQQQK